MSAKWEYHSDSDAAIGLKNALSDMERIEAEKPSYEWSYPDSLLREQANAAYTIRAAIRYFSQPEVAA
jgi:hypothetical protein